MKEGSMSLSMSDLPLCYVFRTEIHMRIWQNDVICSSAQCSLRL